MEWESRKSRRRRVDAELLSVNLEGGLRLSSVDLKAASLLFTVRPQRGGNSINAGGGVLPFFARITSSTRLVDDFMFVKSGQGLVENGFHFTNDVFYFYLLLFIHTKFFAATTFTSRNWTMLASLPCSLPRLLDLDWCGKLWCIISFVIQTVVVTTSSWASVCILTTIVQA